MGRNIHAFRVMLRGDHIRIHALSETKRGTRYIKDGVTVSRQGLTNKEFQEVVEGAIKRLQVAPDRPSL